MVLETAETGDFASDSTLFIPSVSSTPRTLNLVNLRINVRHADLNGGTIALPLELVENRIATFLVSYVAT